MLPPLPIHVFTGCIYPYLHTRDVGVVYQLNKECHSIMIDAVRHDSRVVPPNNGSSKNPFVMIPLLRAGKIVLRWPYTPTYTKQHYLVMGVRKALY